MSVRTYPMVFHRRQWLFATAAGLASMATPSASHAARSPLRRIDLELEGKLARRALVLAPDPPPKARLPVLILLHGLGETRSEEAGIHAWADAYGLDDTYQRLRSPPIERTLTKARYLTSARLGSLNASLSDRAYRGAIYVCPVTPNPSKQPSSSSALDDYARWLSDTLLPEVYQRTNADPSPARTGLDGCSMGGYVALEVFCRIPERFASVGATQAAFGAHRALRYANRLSEALAQSPARTLQLETSTEDPYRAANERLAKLLTKRAASAQLVVRPGPHNQPWLREIGTLEMLLHHERQLWPGSAPP